MHTGSAELAESILEVLRQHLGLTIAGSSDGEKWRLEASDASGERWAAEHEDYYVAACMLAELVGFELEDG